MREIDIEASEITDEHEPDPPFHIKIFLGIRIEQGVKDVALLVDDVAQSLIRAKVQLQFPIGGKRETDVDIAEVQKKFDEIKYIVERINNDEVLLERF